MTIWFAITSVFLYGTIQLLTIKEYTDDLAHFTEALVVLCQGIQQDTLNYKDYVINVLETKKSYLSKYMEDD